MEESARGNACRGEPIEVYGFGKCSVGEPAEGSFIICLFFYNKRSHCQLADNSLPIQVVTVSEIPKYLKFSTMDI